MGVAMHVDDHAHLAASHVDPVRCAMAPGNRGAGAERNALSVSVVIQSGWQPVQPPHPHASWATSAPSRTIRCA